MKSSLSREIPLFGTALVSGILLTAGLFVSVMILANHHANPYRQHPLLVVDLTTWPTPDQQPKPDLKKKPDVKQKPKLKQKPKTPPNPKPVPQPVKQPPNEQQIANAQQDSKDLSEQSVAEQSPVATPPVPAQESLPVPVPIFKLTHAPRFLHKEDPVYPEVMRATGTTGVVKLEALIDKDGRVRRVQILESAGNYFDAAARRAIFASSFYPAKIDNEPVAVLLRLPVKFNLL